MYETDEECVRRCLDGHPEIFRLLVARYEKPLIKCLSGKLGDENDVHEAAQETMVRAYFALARLKKAGSFFPWLLGIADRVAREMQRARQRYSSLRDIQAIPCHREAAPSPTDPGLEELRRAVANLPDSQRQVILMRFYSGQSCAEISRNLGISIGTVTSRLSRAYALLRQALSMPNQNAEVSP